MSADPCGCAEPGHGDWHWQIVKWSYSKAGGYCARNGCVIVKGERIAKAWDGRPGHQTSHGQGPGEWWCEPCALADAAD